MTLPERWHISWAARRTAKLWVVWLVLSAASAALMQGLVMIHVPWLQLAPGSATAQLASRFGPLALLQGIPGVDRLIALVAAYPQASFGFVFMGGALAAKFGDRIHDRSLASFNDDVLTRVGERNRPDRDDDTSETFVHLEWTPGKAGPRHETWTALQNWCVRMAAPTWNWRTDATLSIGVLTGRSGSGKSRMGYELARALAKRDRLGGASPRAVLAARIGIYLRHARDRWSRR